MGAEIKQTKKQNIDPQERKGQIKITSVFKDKGKSFQELIEDIIKNTRFK